jgi:hypothetical protein
MRFFFNVLLVVFYCQVLDAQIIREYDLEKQAEHAEVKGYDPTFRVNYFENIILRTNFSAGVPRIEVLDGISNEVLDIRPAAEYQIGLSVDYKWFAIGFGFTPKFLLTSDSKDELSNSSSYTASLNFFFSDRWRQEFKYNYYRGFFSDSLDTSFGNTELHSIEGATYFIINPNFSFRAHYAQTERQLKSAGSFIPILKYVFSKMRLNQVTNLSNTFNRLNTDAVDVINSLDIIAQIGYMHTFVIKNKWFTTVGLHPGLGYNYSEYVLVDTNSSNDIFNAFTFALNGEVSIGYNSYRWFFGATGDFKNYNYSNIENDEFNRNTTYGSLYFGYRFNDNKPMRKFFGWFEDKFGF